MCKFCILFVDNNTAPSMKESNSLCSVKPCLNLVPLERLKVLIEQIEIDKEVVTDSHDDVVVSDSLMVNTKQTARKSRNGQGSPARFSGKPGGKAAKHMRAAAEDDSNDSSSDGSSSGPENEQAPQPANQVQKTIKVERHLRVWGEKARIYKWPKGVIRKY